MRRTIGCAALLGALLFLPRPAAAQDNNPFSSCKLDDPVRFLGNRPEPIPERPGATRITLTGPVEITCNDMVLFADEVVHEDDTGMIYATGRVSLQQPGLQIFAERAVINGETKLGTFYNASGTARIGDMPLDKSMFGTQEPDVMFRGEEIARTGPQTYTIKNGGFTTCVQPSPRWEMSGANGTVKLDRYALLRHVVLRVKDVPLLYLPLIYYPINKEDRSTGFLMPAYGASGARGASLSNAFFWALGRSHDATFFHDWFMKTGNGFGSEYRYVASPGSDGRVTFYRGSEAQLDTTGAVNPDSVRTWYQVDGGMSQALPGGFRLLANVNYITDIAARQNSQDIVDLSRRSSGIGVNLTGNIGRWRIGAMFDQRDYYYGSRAGNRTGRAPSVNVSLSERPIGRSLVYYGVSGEAAYLVRQNDLSDPTTDTSLWRFDGGPTLRAPISSLPWLRATGTASWRVTQWMETRDPETGKVVPVAMTRQIFNLGAQFVGPVLARVFQTPDNGYATGFKHLIEPSFAINRTLPYFEEARYKRVVQNDSAVDAVIGGATRINYGIMNRLLARRPMPGAAPGSAANRGMVREILSVGITQTYYSNALDSRSDTQFQSGRSASKFSAIQLRAESRPTDVASGQFIMEIDPTFRKPQSVSASSTIHAALADVRAGWSRTLVIEGHPFFTEGNARHTLNAGTTLRTAGNRVGGSYSFFFDAKNKTFIDQRMLFYLNSQCCGVSFDYQHISTPLLNVPTDRRFSVSFTLAGIGSFSNPLGSFGGRR